ncbi:MAG: hypothetical protein PQJ46_03975 [Spirochaetales bacterium]|nr:hypothetical protein [Spirochaetales bacterium]
MKRTGVLNIIHDVSFPMNKVVIHPNTGFDLGFMQIKYSTHLFINCGIEDFKNGTADPHQEIELLLLNECKKEGIEIAQKLWDKLGQPDKAVLIYEEDKNELMIAAK